MSDDACLLCIQIHFWLFFRSRLSWCESWLAAILRYRNRVVWCRLGVTWASCTGSSLIYTQSVFGNFENSVSVLFCFSCTPFAWREGSALETYGNKTGLLFCYVVKTPCYQSYLIKFSSGLPVDFNFVFSDRRHPPPLPNITWGSAKMSSPWL